MTSLEVLSQIKVAPQRPQKWNHGSGKEGAGQGKGNQGNHYTKASFFTGERYTPGYLAIPVSCGLTSDNTRLNEYLLYDHIVP